jgi:hypothetical protein
MSARNVVVVMPFGGKDGIERRRAILNFKRLEYLVRNKCKVASLGSAVPGDHVVYGVEVAKTAMDDIPERALRQIETADILIALVTERNPNVIYEIAYRRFHERTVLLVVDTADNLPLYLAKTAYQPWKQENVQERIDKIATDDLPTLPDFTVGIPNDLKEAIDIYDSELARGLEDALQEIESKFKLPQPSAVYHLRRIVSEEIVTYYPCSIVEVSFSGRNTLENNKQPALVAEIDDGFARLYGYPSKAAAESDRPLTLDKLLARIEPFFEKRDWDDFIKEQIELTQTVIKEGGFARATVPLRINDEHPWKEYRGVSYLPCIVAKVVDDNPDGPHKMYLLVVYVEVPITLKRA